MALATGMGVPPSRATTVEELYDQFRDAVATPGPHLIEAVLTPAWRIDITIPDLSRKRDLITGTSDRTGLRPA